ncbi:MAG TPA: Uma2 family endonuclease [Bryobacteraceae bacterium]
MNKDEFMRRWEAMPDVKHAELIDGIVYMPSPVSFNHAHFQGVLHHWLCTFEDHTPGCQSGIEATWLMAEKDVPSPNCTLRILPELGGQSTMEGIYVAGAPELVIEVAVSSRARDLGAKLKLYENMGVREYLVALPTKQQLFWKTLDSNSRYQPLEPGPDGIFRSLFFPGLWLDLAALWRDDRPQLLTTLRQGLATPDHAAFVSRLAGKID